MEQKTLITLIIVLVFLILLIIVTFPLLKGIAGNILSIFNQLLGK